VINISIMGDINESIGIQPIHIRFISNNNPNSIQILTKNMIYIPEEKDKLMQPSSTEVNPTAAVNPNVSSKPTNMIQGGDGSGETSIYPYFTDTVEFPEEKLKKLPRKELIEVFFNKNQFKKYIRNRKSIKASERSVIAVDNLNILIKLLLCTDFPLKNNITDTFSENIKQTTSVAPTKSDTLFTSVMNIFKTKKYKLCYLNVDRSTFTLISVTRVNDIINDKKFSKLITIASAYDKWRIDLIKKLENSSKEMNLDGLMDKYMNTILKRFTEEDIKNSLKEALRRPKLAIPISIVIDPLEQLSSVAIGDKKRFRELMVKISERNKYASMKSAAAYFIPDKVMEIEGFNKLLTTSLETAINDKFIKTLQSVGASITTLKKTSKAIDEIEIVDKTVASKIEQYSQLSEFSKFMTSNTPPYYRYSNLKLQDALASYKIEGDDRLFNLIRFIKEIGTDEKPGAEYINNVEMIDTVKNDVSSIIEMNPSVDNKQKDSTDANMDLDRAFDLNTNKYYDTCLKLELMRGILDNDNIEDIKCSYQNNKLINLHDELKSNSAEKNPAILYISNKVLDISMFKKKSNTTRKQRTQGGKYKHNTTKKVGGWSTKTPKPKPPKRRVVKFSTGTVQTPIMSL
jgi:hypothetical protein